MNLFAGWQHVRLVRDLDRGGPAQSRSSRMAVTIAVLLALVGLAMTIYLISLRSSTHSNSGPNKETFMTPATNNGIISKLSNHSVLMKRWKKIKAILQAKGVTLFALVDHSGEAEKAGMKMRPTKLLIFGSPKGRLYAPDARRAQQRHRPAAQDSGVGRWPGQGLGFL